MVSRTSKIAVAFLASGTFLTTLGSNLSDGFALQLIKASGAAFIATGTFLMGHEVADLTGYVKAP